MTVRPLQSAWRFSRNELSGKPGAVQCASGLYLWAANMILVRELSMTTIEPSVRDLMAIDEFERAFSFLGVTDATPKAAKQTDSETT